MLAHNVEENYKTSGKDGDSKKTLVQKLRPKNVVFMHLSGFWQFRGF